MKSTTLETLIARMRRLANSVGRRNARIHNLTGEGIASESRPHDDAGRVASATPQAKDSKLVPDAPSPVGNPSNPQHDWPCRGLTESHEDFRARMGRPQPNDRKAA